VVPPELLVTGPDPTGLVVAVWAKWAVTMTTASTPASVNTSSKNPSIGKASARFVDAATQT
jgi:hypothetical protein